MFTSTYLPVPNCSSVSPRYGHAHTGTRRERYRRFVVHLCHCISFRKSCFFAHFSESTVDYKCCEGIINLISSCRSPPSIRVCQTLEMCPWLRQDIKGSVLRISSERWRADNSTNNLIAYLLYIIKAESHGGAEINTFFKEKR